MRHAAHKAAKVSNERFSVAKALFTSSRGSHTAKAVRMVQLANGEGAVVGLEPAVAEKLNEVAPMSRRAMREAARVAGRRSAFMASASLAALVGTAATAMAVGQQNASEMTFADNAATTTQMKRVSDDAASRSESRSGLDAMASTSNSGDWQLGETSSSMDANLLSKSIADNPNVAVLMDQDAGLLPSGFNPNTAPVIPAMTIHTVSAHGGRIPVVHSLACLPEAILAMLGVGVIPLALSAIGLITRHATLAISWYSLQANRVRTAITGMSRLSKK